MFYRKCNVAPGSVVFFPCNLTYLATDVAILSCITLVHLKRLSTEASGRFGDNGLMLLPGTTSVDFIAFGALDRARLQSTLRVEHLAEHLGSPY